MGRILWVLNRYEFYCHPYSHPSNHSPYPCILDSIASEIHLLFVFLNSLAKSGYLRLFSKLWMYEFHLRVVSFKFMPSPVSLIFFKKILILVLTVWFHYLFWGSWVYWLLDLGFDLGNLTFDCLLSCMAFDLFELTHMFIFYVRFASIRNRSCRYVLISQAPIQGANIFLDLCTLYNYCLNPSIFVRFCRFVLISVHVFQFCNMHSSLWFKWCLLCYSI